MKYKFFAPLSALQLLSAFTGAVEPTVINLAARIGDSTTNSYESMLVDTGSFSNAIGRAKLQQLRLDHLARPLPKRYVTIWGPRKDSIIVDFSLENITSTNGAPLTCTTSAEFYIHETAGLSLWAPPGVEDMMILGHPFLVAYGAQIDYQSNVVLLNACDRPASAPWVNPPPYGSLDELSSWLDMALGRVGLDQGTYAVLGVGFIMGMFLTLVMGCIIEHIIKRRRRERRCLDEVGQRKEA